ncbi:hypothetical protein ACGFJT_42290 [Actinomadura geliboluensis]|uniref:AbiJ-related protein n=1 Tax=Actinomadura geliboluensis TaxID=882440 RepID=UPI0037216E84
MAGEMDLAKLRRHLERPAEAYVTGASHKDFDAACQHLGLPVLPYDEGTSKRERFARCSAALPDADLAAVAARVLTLDSWALDAATRNAIQDVLWAGQPALEIPQRTRREIARALEPELERLTAQGDRFRALLDRLWILDTEPLGVLLGKEGSLRAEIDRHVFRFSGDWTVEELFEQLGALEGGHPRFIRFLIGLVSADVVPDEPLQRRLVAILNPHLRAVGAELRETDAKDGYPEFSVVSTRSGHSRPPRALIFATRSKPDIRLEDVLDLDIEVLNDQDNVLVYDRPISSDGLRWRDLHSWWKDTRQITSDDQAKKTLYSRLKACLPKNPKGEWHRAQWNLFALYYKLHGQHVPGLPALLPEVWLHWDPQTISARGAVAMTHHRIDFLLLLPGGHRVVLEVDGMQHYSSTEADEDWKDAKPDRDKYARTVRSDRTLKLAGYEVFRFGTAELEKTDTAEELLREFFAALYREFKVTPT